VSELIQGTHKKVDPDKKYPDNLILARFLSANFTASEITNSQRNHTVLICDH